MIPFLKPIKHLQRFSISFRRIRFCASLYLSPSLFSSEISATYTSYYNHNHHHHPVQSTGWKGWNSDTRSLVCEFVSRASFHIHTPAVSPATLCRHPLAGQFLHLPISTRSCFHSSGRRRRESAPDLFCCRPPAQQKS